MGVHIIDVSCYQWRDPGFLAWVAQHGVDMGEVVRIDIDDVGMTMRVYEFVRDAAGLPLTDYATMKPAHTTRDIPLLSAMPR
jgi:hypothetical protein